ncbi:MAG: hypothetical protein EBZ58_12195 [Bacteroidetes bacterium]|nr:hypothetical protein [Bacteroidota bacterium]
MANSFLISSIGVPLATNSNAFATCIACSLGTMMGLFLSSLLLEYPLGAVQVIRPAFLAPLIPPMVFIERLSLSISGIAK